MRTIPPTHQAGLEGVCLEQRGRDSMVVVTSGGTVSEYRAWVQRSAGRGARRLSFSTPLPAVSTVHLPHNLRCANITIIDQRECENAYPGNITDTMVCASVREEGKDSCQVRGQGLGPQTSIVSSWTPTTPTSSLTPRRAPPPLRVIPARLPTPHPLPTPSAAPNPSPSPIPYAHPNPKSVFFKYVFF